MSSRSPVTVYRELLNHDGFIHIPPPYCLNYGIISLMFGRRNVHLPIPFLPIPCFAMIMFLVESLFMGQDQITRRILPVLLRYVVSQLAYSKRDVADSIQFVLASNLMRMPQYMLSILQNPSRQFLQSPSEKNKVIYAYILAVQDMLDDTISLQSIDLINEALSRHIQRKNILSEIELFAAFMAIIRCIYSDLRNGRKRLSYCTDDVTFSFLQNDETYFPTPSEIISRDLDDLSCFMGFLKNMTINSPFFETIRKKMYDRLFSIFPDKKDVEILLLICLKAGIWIGYDPHDLLLLIRILNCESDVGLEFGKFSLDHDTQNPFDEEINSFKNPSLSAQLSEPTNAILRELEQQF